MRIPHWEFQYIYGGEKFPNSEVRKFYNLFKKEFLNGNPIDVGEYSNYYFFLMFDLIQTQVTNLETHLKRLMESYPKTVGYCEHEMSKLGIACRKYNGEEYVSNGLIYVAKTNFENKDKIIKWLHTSEFSVNGCDVYVNSRGVIDVILNRNRIYGNTKRGIILKVFKDRLPEYIHFGIAEGNVKFTNTGLFSEKNKESGYQCRLIEPHIITTLKGCPIIVKGDFNAENIGINSLVGCPQRVEGNFIVKKNNIKSFEGMPQYIGGLFDISNNELTDEAWDYAKENIDGEFGDYNIKKNLFVKYRKELF